MKQIILFPKGSLTRGAIKKIEAADAVVIEVDDPSKVVTLLPSSVPITGDMVVKAASAAILKTHLGTVREDFAIVLLKEISSAVATQTKPA